MPRQVVRHMAQTGYWQLQLGSLHHLDLIDERGIYKSSRCKDNLRGKNNSLQDLSNGEQGPLRQSSVKAESLLVFFFGHLKQTVMLEMFVGSCLVSPRECKTRHVDIAAGLSSPFAAKFAGIARNR